MAAAYVGAHDRVQAPGALGGQLDLDGQRPLTVELDGQVGEMQPPTAALVPAPDRVPRPIRLTGVVGAQLALGADRCRPKLLFQLDRDRRGRSVVDVGADVQPGARKLESGGDQPGIVDL